jgi:SP family general alpha glucoside:H+ symporter-like MFS transporter
MEDLSSDLDDYPKALTSPVIRAFLSYPYLTPVKAPNKPRVTMTDIKQPPLEIENDAALLKAQAQINTDVEHLMSLRDAVKLYPKSVLYCAVLSMAIIMEGYQVGLVPSLFAQPAFQRKYGRARADGSHQLDSKYQSALTAALQAGSIFGYWLSGIVIEKIGYKRTMQGALVSITCFIFVVFFAPSIVLLVVGEGLLGIPWGIIQTITTTYAAEVSPVALRAYVTSYVNLCWVIGGFISTGVLRGTVNRSDQWAYRIPFALQWIWPLPIIIGVSFAPERYVPHFWACPSDRERCTDEGLQSMVARS